MILGVASGKGGTGKTTVALALAEVAAAGSGQDVRLLDGDVESPSVAVLLRPAMEEDRPAGTVVPVPDPGLCLSCGACADACAFGALALAGGQVLVFDALCHGCGACVTACPQGAMGERVREIGRLRAGRAGPVRFAEGRLEPGEAMATPVIRQLLAWQAPADGCVGLVILDGPPGTACPALATLAHANRALLVTEPTPFGLHDLERIVRVARDVLRLPVAVALNRDDGADDRVERWCEASGIPVVLRLPDDPRVARAAARGEGILEAVPAWRPRFVSALDRLLARNVA